MSPSDVRKRQLYDQLDAIMQELRERSRPILDELVAIENAANPQGASEHAGLQKTEADKRRDANMLHRANAYGAIVKQGANSCR